MDSFTSKEGFNLLSRTKGAVTSEVTTQQVSQKNTKKNKGVWHHDLTFTITTILANPGYHSHPLPLHRHTSHEFRETQIRTLSLEFSHTFPYVSWELQTLVPQVQFIGISRTCPLPITFPRMCLDKKRSPPALPNSPPRRRRQFWPSNWFQFYHPTKRFLTKWCRPTFYPLSLSPRFCELSRPATFEQFPFQLDKRLAPSQFSPLLLCDPHGLRFHPSHVDSTSMAKHG